MKRICVSFAELMASVRPETEHFLDTETIGFYGAIRLLQVYCRDWDAVRYVERPTGLQFIEYMTALAKVESSAILQNAHYDLTTGQQQGSTSWTEEPASAS